MKSRLSFPVLIVLLFSSCCVISAQTFVASHNKAKADSLIQTIDKSAGLLLVKSDSVFIDGTSSSWFYSYEGFSSCYNLHTTQTAVIFDSTSSTLYGPSIITKTWFDSDSALVLAEAQGGQDFRLHNPHYKIWAGLGQTLVPNAVPYWGIYYRSTDDTSKIFSICFDATDSTLTGVTTASQALPVGFVLYQNYPNPFNPDTRISFGVPYRSFVSVTVYDVLGREITKLASRVFEPGSYALIFKGEHCPSGVYFYRLQSGSFTHTGKMLLAK